MNALLQGHEVIPAASESPDHYGRCAACGCPAEAVGATAGDAPEQEVVVWSEGGLVAIVRRRDGRTIEVLRVAGRD